MFQTGNAVKRMMCLDKCLGYNMQLAFRHVFVNCIVFKKLFVLQ